MTEKNKSEISPQKRSLKLTPLLGDWTTYRPPRTLVKKVKIGLYGFDRLSEDELKQAHIMHYNFAQKFCESLKKKLKIGCDIYSVEAQQNTYLNFTKNFTAPIFQGKFVSTNYHDEIFVSFDIQLIDVLINQALGSQETSRLNRALTEAEEIILDDALPEHLLPFYEMYKDVLQNPKFEKVGSPIFSQDNSINQQATFVCFVIELGMNGVMGKIVIGYSGAFIKNLIKKISQVQKKPPLTLTRLNPSVFNLVELPVAVTLGKTSLTMSDLNNLEVGDVVSFDQNINNAIPITLSDGHTILGQAGKKEGRLIVRVAAVEKEKAVRITPPLYEEPKEEILDQENPEELSSAEFDKIGGEDLELSEEEFSDEDLEGSLEEEDFEEKPEQ